MNGSGQTSAPPSPATRDATGKVFHPTRSERIAALVADLTPGLGPLHPIRDASAWLLISWSSAAALIWLLGPFRAGALAQWMSSPRFQLETVVVVLLSVLGGGLAALAAIPARASARRSLALVLALVAGWAALLVWALVVPPFAPSMDGKRAACVLEVIADAALPYALGLWWLRRRYAVLSPAATGAVLGLAAGAAPAILMQLACVYEGGHGLRFHLGPLLACAIAGAAIAAWTTSRR